MKKDRKITLGEDYYLDPSGLWVFTESFLKSRGYCCRSGCKHCPYGFKFVSITPTIVDEAPDSEEFI